MANMLSQLASDERARLLEELNYMNLQEIRAFCAARAIPFRIVAEYANGKVKATKDTDRKAIVLARVRTISRPATSVGPPVSLPRSSARRIHRGVQGGTIASTIAGTR